MRGRIVRLGSVLNEILQNVKSKTKPVPRTKEYVVQYKVMGPRSLGFLQQFFPYSLKMHLCGRDGPPQKAIQRDHLIQLVKESCEGSTNPNLQLHLSIEPADGEYTGRLIQKGYKRVETYETVSDVANQIIKNYGWKDPFGFHLQ